MDGYIVERVISSQKQNIQFSSVIEVFGIEHTLSAPLLLKHAEVVSISPIHCGMKESASPCNTIHSDRVLLKLRCVVVDARGCASHGWTQIEMDVRPPSCIGIIGRSAEFRIGSARFFGNCAFKICAEICIYTIVSRREVITHEKCKDQCEFPPLYPAANRICLL